ncbi:MAG TPA: YadA-like family protein [Stenotrophomonas sp.]|nr:YadA-like family protein [Stenotrophomonas sp.]
MAVGAGSVADRDNVVAVGSVSFQRQVINVAAGTADTDAVNVKQLKDAGFTFSGGAVLNRGLTYVSGSIEAGTPRVELAAGTGNSRYFADTNGDGIGERDAPLPKGTRISNVADGVLDTDAVTLGQLRDISNSTFDSRTSVFASAATATAAADAPLRAMPRMSANAMTAITTSVAATGSGVDSASRQRTTAMKQANYYLKVNGRGDAVGSTAPTDDASAAGAGSIAIGSDSGSSADNGIALGALARVTARDAIALGTGSVADQENTVSVGSAKVSRYAAYANDGATTAQLTSAANTRRIVNMAAGIGETDAVNVAQLRQLTQGLGGGADFNPDGSLKAPIYNVAGGSYSSVGAALGGLDARLNQASARMAQARNSQGDSAGAGLVQQDASGGAINVALNTDGTRINFAGMAGDRTLAGVGKGRADNDGANVAQLRGVIDGLGGGATVSADGSISGPTYVVGGSTVRSAGEAIGNLDTRVSNNSAAIQALGMGGGVKYLSVKSTAAAATATGAEAVAVGPQANATGGASVALGSGAQAGADNSVAIGAGANATKANSVSVGSAGKERSISNVAAGTEDTDAVNVSQLKQAQEGVARYDRGTGGESSDYTSLSLGGPGGMTTTTVRNVRAGVADTDAVNVSQLQAGMGQTLSEARTYTDSRIQQVQQDAWTARREARGGTAAAMAMAGMPQAYLPGKSMLAAAASSFQGESALAIGLSGVSESGRYVYKAQTSANTRGDLGVTVGAGFQW